MIVWWMSGMWRLGPLLTASFCFQMVNLSSLSLLSLWVLHFVTIWNKGERARWERREEARGGDQENPSPSFIPSPLLSWLASCQQGENWEGTKGGQSSFGKHDLDNELLETKRKLILKLKAKLYLKSIDEAWSRSLLIESWTFIVPGRLDSTSQHM